MSCTNLSLLFYSSETVRPLSRLWALQTRESEDYSTAVDKKIDSQGGLYERCSFGHVLQHWPCTSVHSVHFHMVTASTVKFRPRAYSTGYALPFIQFIGLLYNSVPTLRLQQVYIRISLHLHVRTCG